MNKQITITHYFSQDTCQHCDVAWLTGSFSAQSLSQLWNLLLQGATDSCGSEVIIDNEINIHY